MSGNLYVETDEIRIRVLSDEGTLEYNRELDVISLDSTVGYSTLIKMIKLLKREKNKRSFTDEFFD